MRLQFDLQTAFGNFRIPMLVSFVHAGAILGGETDPKKLTVAWHADVDHIGHRPSCWLRGVREKG